MTRECPKCKHDNPPETQYCGQCGALMPQADVKTQTFDKGNDELSTGSIFDDRYQVIEELGKGGMGRVYKVIDKELNEKMALKLIRSDIASNQETIQRFRNELKLARRIGHRNVCRMYELNQFRGSYYITMEYVRGEDLKAFIRRSGRLTVGKAITIAKQICKGLSEAHRLGVVHRDLKSQNIMIDEDGNARIMDFGIARSLTSKGLTDLGVMIGTPTYMSPEQVEGKAVDQRTDIYSLGIILFEMLTGRLPFEGESPFAVGLKQKSEVPPDPQKLNPDIPGDLAALILKCLEKEKEARFQRADEILTALENAEKGIPTTEVLVAKRRSSTSKTLTVTFDLKKNLVLISGALLVIAAVFLIWTFLPKKAPPRRSIAVISFENQTGEDSYGYLEKAIPNLLITSLEQSKYLRVTTWERMHDLMKQIGRPDAESIDTDMGFELCRMEGVEAIVIGSFVKAGDVFATDVKVMDVESKELLKSAGSQGRGVQSILSKQIEELSKEISSGVGLKDRDIDESDLRTAEFTTSSMDAYEQFIKGMEFFSKLYYQDALQYFEKAVSLDPEFASAHLYLGITSGRLNDPKRRAEALEAAMRCSSKASEKERLYIQASYADAVERDQEKRARFLNEIIEKYPQEKMAHFLLIEYYRYLGNSAKALEEADKILSLDPDHAPTFNQMAYTHMDLGDFNTALSFFKRYSEMSPNDVNPIDSMGELYLRLGETENAIANYRRVLDQKPDFFTAYIQLAYAHALNEDYDKVFKVLDDFAQAAKSINVRGSAFWYQGLYKLWLGDRESPLSNLIQLAAMADSIQYGEGGAYVHWLIACILLDKGENSKSRDHLNKFRDGMFSVYPQESFPNIYSSLLSLHLYYTGLIDLREGDPAQAIIKADQIMSLVPDVRFLHKPFLEYIALFLRGEALLSEGKAVQAVEVLERASSPGTPWHYSFRPFYNIRFIEDALARAYIQKGDIPAAIKEYERLITFDPDEDGCSLINPLNYYRLAKLCQKAGQPDQAAQNFTKFLSFWKYADQSRPEVIDARESLSVLEKD